MIREADGALGWRSAVTRCFERVAAGTDYNRARVLEFRPAREIIERLRALGLSADSESASEGTPFSNVLIVARKKAGH